MKLKWKKEVTQVTEKKKREKLIEMCITRNGDGSKTKDLLTILRDDGYVRRPLLAILNKSSYLCRAQIMSLYGMLDCGKNFKTGYRGENCRLCNVLDDENHRIDYCKKYKNMNLFFSSTKVDFESIHSGKEEVSKRVLKAVCSIWNLQNGKNTMRT